MGSGSFYIRAICWPLNAFMQKWCNFLKLAHTSLFGVISMACTIFHCGQLVRQLILCFSFCIMFNQYCFVTLEILGCSVWLYKD